MTEKLLTYPSPTSPDPGDGVNRSKFNFFLNSTNTNQTNRHLYRHNMRGSRIFLSGVGGGSRLLNLFYSLQKGPVVSLHIFQGVQMPISIETHITITCDFPGGGGVWTTSPLWIRTWTMWHFGTYRLRRAFVASF